MTMTRLSTCDRPANLRRWLACGVVAGVLCAAVGAARANDWPTPGLDAAHGRLSSERSGAAFGDGRWSFAPSAHAPALASPVAADGYIVSADLDGVVNALRADTGGLVWRVSLGASVQGTPAIANGRVFVPTLGGKIVALALADGSSLWSSNLGGLNVSSPAIVNGDLIVGAGLPRQVVVRLDGVTGAVVWETPPGMEQFSNTPPAVAGGLVVVGTNAGHYYAFDATTGLPRWDYRADGIVNIASPLIAAGRVFMAGGEKSDRVHAVDAATGAAIPGWPISLPAPDPDVAGTRIYRRRAISSFALVSGHLILETRLDDALDTDADGLADHYLSRESALAVDATSGAIVWQHPVARLVFTDPDDVPSFLVCPTPAAFAVAAGGNPMVAVASSLVGTVNIVDASTGTETGNWPTAGRALASPVMANGRLVTVAENGTIDGRLSEANHPPATPLLAANPQPLDAADVTLRWSPSMDVDGDQSSYELRVDSDGEVLMTYGQQLFSESGASSIALTVPLTPGVTYTFSVRARDPNGAMSGWSAPETFTVATSGTVMVNGNPAANLQSAVAAALAGDVIELGAGTFHVSSTVRVPAGVTLRGAGAGRTTLDTSGLPVGVSFAGTDPKTPGLLDGATVTGAATCVAVTGTATNVRLSHLVIHDCTTSGISISAGGNAAITTLTVANNGTGVDSAGTGTIKNSLLTGNAVGLRSQQEGGLTSSYDDLFANTTPYVGLTAGTGDLATAVTFVDAASHNFMLRGPQASTDQGDPADPVDAEPTPNGGRINLGAFGGTAEAELSAPAALTDDTSVLRPTPTTAPAAVTSLGGKSPRDNGGSDLGGCSISGRPAARGLPAVILVVLPLLRSRSRRQRPRITGSTTSSS